MIASNHISLTKLDIRQISDIIKSAQQIGLVGELTVDEIVKHSTGFAEIICKSLGCPPQKLLDIGSGSGIPALVLTKMFPTTQITLVERKKKRYFFLKNAIDELGVADKCYVINSDIIDLYCSSEFFNSFDCVLARLFANFAIFLEIGLVLAKTGGICLTSTSSSVYGYIRRKEFKYEQDIAEIKALRLKGYSYVLAKKLKQVTYCFPRTIKEMEKRPLFHVKP